MALFKKRSGKMLTVPANGPELSCGGEQPPQRNAVARTFRSDSAKFVPQRAAKSSTAGSVSLSDWLGWQSPLYFCQLAFASS